MFRAVFFFFFCLRSDKHIQVKYDQYVNLGMSQYVIFLLKLREFKLSQDMYFEAETQGYKIHYHFKKNDQHIQKL